MIVEGCVFGGFGCLDRLFVVVYRRLDSQKLEVFGQLFVGVGGCPKNRRLFVGVWTGCLWFFSATNSIFF